MAESANPSGNGIGIGTVLFIVFLVLKLCHVIDWSWWWITAPLWGVLALLAVLFVIAGILTLIGRALESPQDRARRRAADALRKYGRGLR